MTTYFPEFSVNYLNPNLSVEIREGLNRECRLNIEKAIEIIRSPSKESVTLQTRVAYTSIPNSSICSFISYFLGNCPQIIKSAIPCLPRNHDHELVTRPIPRTAYHTLANSRMDFEGNTCCLIIGTPPIIVTAGLLSANPLVGVAFGIVANLLILQTAGINTYACSGDVGVVSDAQGRLLLQDGLRADAIPSMKKAYLDIAAYLKEKQRGANSPEEQEETQNIALEIKNRWEMTCQEIANCGIAPNVVEEILAPLSVVLFEIENAIHIQEPTQRFV